MLNIVSRVIKNARDIAELVNARGNRKEEEEEEEERAHRCHRSRRGMIAFASLLPNDLDIFLRRAANVRVNPGEFNTRLNVRERYADLRRQFITHFKADDVENAW